MNIRSLLLRARLRRQITTLKLIFHLRVPALQLSYAILAPPRAQYHIRSIALPRAGGNLPAIAPIAPTILRVTRGRWLPGSSFTRVAHIRLHPPCSMMECHTMPLEATSRTPMANHCTIFPPHVGYLIPNVSKHRPYRRQVKMEIQPPSITWARSPQGQPLVQAV